MAEHPIQAQVLEAVVRLRAIAKKTGTRNSGVTEKDAATIFGGADTLLELAKALESAHAQVGDLVEYLTRTAQAFRSGDLSFVAQSLVRYQPELWGEQVALICKRYLESADLLLWDDEPTEDGTEMWKIRLPLGEEPIQQGQVVDQKPTVHDDQPDPDGEGSHGEDLPRQAPQEASAPRDR